MCKFMRQSFLGLTLLVWGLAGMAQGGSDRVKVAEFLKITGFDVALESIRLSASSAPDMLGVNADDFGIQWTRMADTVFQTDKMHDLALEILTEALEPSLLDHASGFYGSEFGQRLVAAENASHMEEDDDAKTEAGEAIVAGLVRIGSARVQELKRMNDAIGGVDSSIRAITEIQVRFMMAAAGAGVVELRMDEADLRALLAENDDDMRLALQSSALSGAAYTYQAFSDAEISQYADALENPEMRQVYELMSAVQYEVMANRFEALAAAMASLQPSTDL